MLEVDDRLVVVDRDGDCDCDFIDEELVVNFDVNDVLEVEDIC